MKYILGDQTHPTKTEEASAALDEARVIAWSSEIDEGDTVFIFDSDSDFRAWARSAASPIPGDTKKIEELARKARELEQSDNTAALAVQDLGAERALADLDNLAERFDLNRTSPELIKLAHEGVSVLEPPVLRSGILCDGFACSGSIKIIPTGIPFPTLGNFRDRATSVTGAGGVTLWENNWFGGRSTFIFTVGVCIDLGQLNFNNIASSAIAV